jgi:hypothetical protein
MHNNAGALAIVLVVFYDIDAAATSASARRQWTPIILASPLHELAGLAALWSNRILATFGVIPIRIHKTLA